MDAQTPSRELSLDETLRMSINIYLRNIVILVTPFLASSLVTGGLLALRGNFVPDATPYSGSFSSEYWNHYWSFLWGTLILVAAVALVAWLLSGITGGICIKLSSDAIENRRTSLGESFETSVRKLAKVLATSLVCVVLIALGIFAFVVPGIIIAVMYSLVLPVIIVGNTGATDSLSRSKRLV